MRQLNEQIIPTQAAASVTTSAVNTGQVIYASAQVVATGAGAAGTLVMQASNDPVSGTTVNGGANWSNITGATVTVAGAGAYLIPVQTLCYQWIRYVYTNTGTGTIAVNHNSYGV